MARSRKASSLRTRPPRVRLTREETLRRMRRMQAFDERKDRFIADVRKGEHDDRNPR